MNAKPILTTILALGAAQVPAGAVTLSVDIIQGNAELLAAWNNYTGGGALVIEDNNPGIPGNPGVATEINFRRAQVDDLAQNPIGIFDVGGIGPGGEPGNMKINADARSWNYGGRSGALALTDVFIQSTIRTAPGTPVIIRMEIEELFGIDDVWLSGLDPNAQWGWTTGISANIALSDPGQRVDIGVVPTLSLVYDRDAPGVGVFAEQINEPVGGGFDFYNVADVPVKQGDDRPPNGVDIFPVSYVVDFVINSPAGGAANPIEIRMDNSLDGLGSGSGFGDESQPLPPGIPEPAFLLLGPGMLLPLLRRRRTGNA